jgi:hypothetical protein
MHPVERSLVASGVLRVLRQLNGHKSSRDDDGLSSSSGSILPSPVREIRRHEDVPHEHRQLPRRQLPTSLLTELLANQQQLIAHLAHLKLQFLHAQFGFREL